MTNQNLLISVHSTEPVVESDMTLIQIEIAGTTKHISLIQAGVLAGRLQKASDANEKYFLEDFRRHI